MVSVCGTDLNRISQNSISIPPASRCRCEVSHTALDVWVLSSHAHDSCVHVRVHSPGGYILCLVVDFNRLLSWPWFSILPAWRKARALIADSIRARSSRWNFARSHPSMLEYFSGRASSRDIGEMSAERDMFAWICRARASLQHPNRDPICDPRRARACTLVPEPDSACRNRRIRNRPLAPDLGDRLGQGDANRGRRYHSRLGCRSSRCGCCENAAVESSMPMIANGITLCASCYRAQSGYRSSVYSKVRLNCCVLNEPQSCYWCRWPCRPIYPTCHTRIVLGTV